MTSTLPARFFGATLLPTVITCAFVHAFQPDTFDRTQIVHAPEGAIRFAHLQNLVRGRRADSRNLLQLQRRSRIQIHGTQRRLLGGGKWASDTKGTPAPTSPYPKLPSEFIGHPHPLRSN